MKKKNTKKDNFRFVVAVPVSLHDQLQTEAQKERRSRNAQVIRVLEERYQELAKSEMALAQ